MKFKPAASIFLSLAIFSPSLFAEGSVKPAPNGITLPEAYKDWRVISISHRTDNHSLRSILGNDIAVKAARSGNTHPWPRGSILAKLVWKEKAKEHWPTAIAPDRFVHAEFMFKDSEKYRSTGGWGYARWLGMDQKPYGKDSDFAQECVTCHTPVKDNDWVFTTPAIMP
ncbi:MAG TPA: cytochrome P460 [Gammaproteobacteria bacterium]|nr:cytochrome P460 [Gammaproteobacteria bacterium]